MTKNYTVQYNWGTEFPEGKTPPQNNKSYPSEQQARDAVDTEYTSTTSIKGQKGGKNGTWTFSGWDTGRLINDTTVVFSGSWSFTEDTTPEPPVTYTVRYDWGTESPTNETLPQNSNSYSSEQQAKADVDTNYTSTTSIRGQKDGKNGTWTFSGWDTGRLINDTTVVFSGSWTFTEDTTPEPPVTKNYTVKYDWGSEFPKGEKLPQNSNSYSSEQQAKAAVDKKYTSTTRIQAQKDGKNGTWAFSGWDAGNLNGTTVVFRGSWSFTADTAPITPPSGTASYKITATAGIGGTISPGGTTTVSAAGQLTYTIKANEGYYIADVKVDGSEVTATTSYTFSDVNTDHTIEVTFKQESQTPDVPDVIAPSITTQPGNATVKVGETASFTIAASGTDLTYQWQIDRNDGKGWVNIDGATATSYTTSTVNISCNGFKYKCVVSNSAGNVESNSATLTVQDAGGSDNPDTPNNTYQIIDGANSSWTHDSDGNITIRGNGDFSKFTGVKVDGNLIDKSNYTAKEGSTIITLKASYLNTLSAGNHTVEILWTDGSASTTFTTKANISDNSNNNQNDNNNSNSSDDKPSSGTDKKDVTAPKTGDNTPSVWLFILSVLSGTGLIITVKKRRENLNS